ncbi:hypothetical protein [Luteipulveratus halotolerans]|uniref:DUF559 domain-containing protein n=1 Tax=Luteipulveratus halotolerans TaxID=1631356 RepID=A0A0L6CMZ9_9MICO|nr:hypothetical protein [Luteipulveratus halotolerans]KNX39119.1 hypothetical protein VV01_01880 [Luteipulveratus halotolerans]
MTTTDERPQPLTGRGRPRREARHRRTRDLAQTYDGVASRALLRRAGITRHDVSCEVAAGRWSLHGTQTVVLSPGRLTAEARWWAALWETGCGAVLDGVTALHAAGLRGFDSDTIHVSVPGGHRPRRCSGVVAHTLRHVGETRTGGVPRTAPEVAAVRAAQWAISDQQAALLLAMSVQQRLVLPDRLLDVWRVIKRSPRRAFIDRTIRDVCDGAQALSELEFGALCRERGLPEPTRQSVRTLSSGRAYLDVEWVELGVAVEVDGSYHFQGLQPVEDALRHNEVAAEGTVVLRVPLLGIRLAPGRFLDQVERALQLAMARHGVSDLGVTHRERLGSV